MKRKLSAPITTLIATCCLAANLNVFAIGPAVPVTDCLSDDEVADLLFMREEEKVARDSYFVLMEKWELPIFANIAESEQRHMDAVGHLIEIYGLTDPVVDETGVGSFTDPGLQLLFDELGVLGLQSIMDGLMVGAMIEETDIADLEDTIHRTTHDNILAVYENLLCGSRNHLRAFTSQIELYGGSYTPAVLDEAKFNEIVDSATERGCGRSARRGSGGPQGNGQP